MNTQRSIATISYNTPKFLESKLKELAGLHIISDYMFILHYAESDETKDHIHLWIKPNKRLDTMYLQEYFEEPDPKHLDKMLGCIDFVTSDVDEWIPYAVHNARYLQYKREHREFTYCKEDIVFKDEMTFEERYRHAFRSSKWNDKLSEQEIIINNDISGYDLINSGYVDWSKASALLAYERLGDRHCDRGGRSNHENNLYCEVNDETKS